MSYPYRLEPIVDLLSGEAIGHELLAGETACPAWNDAEWRDWYAYLAVEIPLLLPDLHGLAPGTGLLFINLDGHQLLDGRISGSIRSLRDYAHRIVIEWTEQRFRDEQLVDVLAKLNFLKGLGFRVAIDDIGAKMSVDGLSRAGAVRASFCKIDGPYFRSKSADSLRGLCQHLSHGGARVVVEWVETEEDYRLALSAGAHLGQGHLWTYTGSNPAGSDEPQAALPGANLPGALATIVEQGEI